MPIIDSVLTHPMGLPGVPFAGDQPIDEWARGLQGRSAARAYREMRDSPTSGAVVHLIRTLISGASLSLAPTKGRENDPDAIAEVARWERELAQLGELRHQLGELADNACTYGAGVSEIVVELDRSGRLRTLDLEIRASDTLEFWHLDNHDRPLRAEQVLADGRRAWLDLGRCVHWPLGTHNRNPAGRSIYRAAWPAFALAGRALEREAIGIDRDMTGVPFGRAPLDVLAATSASPEHLRVRRIFEDALKRMQAGASAGILWPAAEVGGEKTGYDISPFPSAGAGRLVPDVTIRRLESRILQSCFASFLELGLTSGSRALAGPQINLFMKALGGLLADALAALRRQWIQRIVRWEGRDPEIAPVLTAAPLDAPSLDELITMLSSASNGGLIIPTDAIARWLLGMMPGAPVEGTPIAEPAPTPEPQVDAPPAGTT